MPRIHTSKQRHPEGWEIIEPTLLEFEQKMRDAEQESHEGKRKNEALWPIFRIHHQRSRYIFEMFYKKREISKQLYEYCLREKIADAPLIAKWKKQGYERLCCLSCMQTRDHNFQTTCICRVPKIKLDQSKVIECDKCGCRGCATGD